MRTSWIGAIGLGALVVVSVQAGETPRTRPDVRALRRCERTIAREGLVYSHHLNWKIARCVVQLADCEEMPGSTACATAMGACQAAASEMVDIAGRFGTHVLTACSAVPLDRLLTDGGFGGCEVDSLDALTGCIAVGVRKASAAAIRSLEPDACALVQGAGLAAMLPVELCAPLEQCEPVPCEPQPCEPQPCEPQACEPQPCEPQACEPQPCEPQACEPQPCVPDGGGDPNPEPETCVGTLACGGAANLACPTGFVCDRADALCDPTASGQCVPAPAQCAPGTPVCGCDGVTYASDCARVAAGAMRATNGACPATGAACRNNGDCPSGTFCEQVTGDCGASSLGVCRTRAREACDLCVAQTDGAACGCNFQTYATECDRRAAGVSKLWQGACF